MAWVGLTEDQAKAQGHGKILGGGMVGTYLHCLMNGKVFANGCRGRGGW